jgi:hypothetical protein
MKAPSVTDGNATTTGDQAAIIDTEHTPTNGGTARDSRTRLAHVAMWLSTVWPHLLPVISKVQEK